MGLCPHGWPGSAELPGLPTAELHICRKPTSLAPRVYTWSSLLSAPAKGNMGVEDHPDDPNGKGRGEWLCTHKQHPPKSRVSTNANSETIHGIWESHRLGKAHKYTAPYIT